MLRIYFVALEVCRDASRIARLIEKHDRDLANQLRRAASSAPLNIAEGSGSFGGNRKQRYHTAFGSSNEVLACYDTAQAMGYIDPVSQEARDRVNHVIGTLVNVLRLRQ
jgi:four helix bundle protein